MPPDGIRASTARPPARLVLLLLPLVVGVLGAPAVTPGRTGDELSDARARQAQLKKDVAAQKDQIAQLTALQGDLAQEISQTASVLKGINADLAAVKVRITAMQAKIDVIQSAYDALVVQLRDLDAELVVIAAQEAAKKAELAERKALLAERIRSAYDTDRTSLLETFLSGDTFTDMLAEMSYYIDVGEQDKALAEQIAQDQETLAALHQTIEDTRAQTNDLRQETAAQKRTLDQSLAELKATKAALKALEKRTAAALAKQKASLRGHRPEQGGGCSARWPRRPRAQKKLQGKIAALVRKQCEGGNIPSEYNGTLCWPMAGT